LCENLILIGMAKRMWRWCMDMLLQRGMQCRDEENAVLLPFVSFKYWQCQTFCSWPISTEAQVQNQVSPCGIFEARSGIGTELSPNF